MLDRDTAFTPAYELKERIATKQISPVELTELYLDRIERLDSQLNSYLLVDRDGALKSAKAAEDVGFAAATTPPVCLLGSGTGNVEISFGTNRFVNLTGGTCRPAVS